MTEINDELKDWERNTGVNFLRNIGIKRGQRVLDFGSGSGHYSIPSSLIIGNKGKVYAVDEDANALNNLKEKISERKIKNIIVVNTNGELKINLEDGSIDVVLLYDILHYFRKEERKELYREAFRVLRTNATLSVYPKHTKNDFPWDYFADLTKDDVRKEIENSGFYFLSKRCGILMHYGSLNNGCVFNFRKPKI